jgi:putative oxidoreductase
MTATIAATTIQDRANGKLGAGVLAYVGLLGRILYSGIFIMSGPNHFKAHIIGYAASQRVPLASIAVPLSGIIALLGGLSIALGYRAKLGAWLIVLFLVPVTLMLHRFWGVSDPQVAQMQLAMFMKNVSLLGTALIIARLGSGPLSLQQD